MEGVCVNRSFNAAKKIAVLGAGSWGTALAIHLAKAGHDVTLWTHSVEQCMALQALRANTRYLSGIVFPEALNVSHSLDTLIPQAEAVLIVVPSHAFRVTLQAVVKSGYSDGVHLAWATKGFDPLSQCLLHDVVLDELGGNACGMTVLSGPTFAKEVAMGLPTAMVSASESQAEAAYWASLFHFDAVRMYTQTDIVGVEVGGAYKNIIAIAVGMSDGLGLGANARAALISRGLVEMMRLGEVLGAQAETLMGLAGLGDLVLTCTDDQSRNRSFGRQLAERERSNIQMSQVVEGVKAVDVVYKLAHRRHLDLPIMEQVYRVVSGQVAPGEAASALLARAGRSEV